jgi:amino-acid N-acetyltransferase
MLQSYSNVDFIREAFHYQSRYHNALLVFKIDFPLTEHPAFSYIMKDIALLARTGFRVVIVPGAKEHIDAVLTEYGLTSRYSGTTRVTTVQSIPFVEMAAFYVATRFMASLQSHKVDAVIGNFVRARGLGVVSGLDFEHTGTVDKILNVSIKRLLNQDMIVILPCIGLSASGKPYNVPSDEIALAASVSLEASKLFIVSAQSALYHDHWAVPKTVLTDEDGRIIRLTPAEAELVLSINADKPAPELRLAVQACKSGVDRVHIIDGRMDGAILQELFSNLGAGTMVYVDDYESIRLLKSTDIPDILRLMEPLMQQGILLRRTMDTILEKMADYIVFEVDGSIHACGALHNWGEGQGEIAALATDPAYTDMGLGRRIVRYCIDWAAKQGLSRVFVLTISTQDWFEALGFTECPVESLPTGRRIRYDHNRNSKVFAVPVIPGQ